jgi:trehalose 6-phosphate synthase
VAAQTEEDPGVLVLSRFAGACHELEGAVLVNPYDIEGTAAAIARALDMPAEERRERWRPMIKHLERFTAEHWCGMFLAALSQEKPAMGPADVDDIGFASPDGDGAATHSTH